MAARITRTLSWLKELRVALIGINRLKPFMTNTDESHRNPNVRGCMFLGMALLLLCGVGLAWWIAVVSAVLGPKEPWSLAEHLPNTVEVLEEIADQTGMDSFFLLKGRFTSEEEITEICTEYNLLPDQDDVSALSFSGLYDEQHEIEWFPLSNVTRRYAFNTVNWDGSQKENAEGRYEAVIWIDDENHVFVLQLACL